MSRALVVGLGRMGGFHRDVLDGLGYDVTTIDPDPGSGADHGTIAEAMLGGRRRNGHGSGAFDVAAVAVPHEHLVDSAFQLAGTRMLVEKPFATDVGQGRMLEAYLARAGAPVCVGFQERFNPQVRMLRGALAAAWSAEKPYGGVTGARFVRWSDRPCADPALDLLTHDVDLARHLHLWGGDEWRAEFDVRWDQPEKARLIEIKVGERTLAVDLMAHSANPLLGPLTALWHAFLTDQRVPGPDDAIRALELARQVWAARTSA